MQTMAANRKHLTSKIEFYQKSRSREHNLLILPYKSFDTLCFVYLHCVCLFVYKDKEDSEWNNLFYLVITHLHLHILNISIINNYTTVAKKGLSRILKKKKKIEKDK